MVDLEPIIVNGLSDEDKHMKSCLKSCAVLFRTFSTLLKEYISAILHMAGLF